MTLDKLEAALAPYDMSLPEVVPLLASLLSLPLSDRYSSPQLTPQRQKQKTLEVILALLRAQAVQQPALFVAEHPQAPLDRCANAALTVGAAPARITEPGHVVLQHGQDLANRERGDAGCRQFDRQRDTVE